MTNFFLKIKQKTFYISYLNILLFNYQFSSLIFFYNLKKNQTRKKSFIFPQVNPDKPQEAARILVLEQDKELYVPVPRLKEGLLKHITVQDNTNKNQIREAVSRRGLEFDGRTISIDDELKLDLLVLGSVAVSKQGYRIGKGKGYADLEFALLLDMKAITDNTVVVTVVHDCQVRKYC